MRRYEHWAAYAFGPEFNWIHFCGGYRQGDRGSMLWSKFSAIFDNFRRKKIGVFSKTNVIIIFLNSFVLSQKRQFFRRFFGENIFKIVTSVPDWPNFCPLGNCFHWAVFWKWQKWRKFLGCFFPRYRGCINFDEQWVGLQFGRLFHQLVWSPWLPSTTWSWKAMELYSLQGDRTGRIFTYWAVVYFGQFIHRSSQGCQMVCFQTKNPNLGKFWSALCRLEKVDIFYDHL
jgi:hypothetical protein